MVDKSANINKPKESLNSDGQQFYIGIIKPKENCLPSLSKHSFGLLILVELSTITAKTFFLFFDIGRIIDHLC
jgi:hypothetical protein